jgi:hypothetical protein
MEQRLRDALANIEANRQQFEQQLQEANGRNQALSAHLQKTQEALTTIRRALDITPRSEAAPEYGDGSALAPAGGSSSRARPAPSVVKRERMSEGQINTSALSRSSKRVKEELPDEKERISTNSDEIIELSD